MVCPSLTKRCAAAAALLLHLLVLGLLPLADARLEAAELEQAVHIEADGGCAPIHNDLTCEICRTLRAPSRAPAVSGLGFAPTVTPQPAELHSTELTPQLGRPLTLHSRAPPPLRS